MFSLLFHRVQCGRPRRRLLLSASRLLVGPRNLEAEAPNSIAHLFWAFVSSLPGCIRIKACSSVHASSYGQFTTLSPLVRFLPSSLPRSIRLSTVRSRSDRMANTVPQIVPSSFPCLLPAYQAFRYTLRRCTSCNRACTLRPLAVEICTSVVLSEDYLLWMP